MPTPTVVPDPGFSAEEEAKALRSAMKGLGTDEKAIVVSVARMANAQRQEVIVIYKTMYGRDLISDLKSELGGDFEDTVLALFMKPADFDATCLHKAMKGLGTKDKVLCEIMASRTNEQIQAIKVSYKKLFKNELEKDIIGDTSGDYKRILISLCQGARSEDPHVDQAKAAAEAQKLHSAGEKQFGTDEAVFNSIIALRSYPQLQATFHEYKKLTGHDFIKAIQKEFSGNVEDGLSSVVMVAQDTPLYFAQLLHKSMKGAGTDEDRLIRVVVSRSEIDLGDVKEAFNRTYGKPLSRWIRDDCGGDFRRMLLAITKD
ncbi:annexin-B12-like [Sycon ciliatum]|uniref:annexin-B12-like n=1 Tax=Sycon ciliatum TaxID=27933 RepID=UPI0031F656E2